MHTDDHFRCPFEVQAKQAGKIITFRLDDDHGSRMTLFARGLTDFYADDSLVGLRFILPSNILLGCHTLEKLREVIFPFQCEQLAAEIECRLYPFLPFQPYKARLDSGDLTTNESIYLTIASALCEGIAATGSGEFPSSASDISKWINTTLTECAATGIKDAQLCLLDPKNRIPFPLLRTIPGSLLIEIERLFDHADAKLNRNLFGVVKCPFYPQAFGRYSEDLEFVLSREADFASIPSSQRRRIRTMSNYVLQKSGVRILNLGEDKQNTGLWIPSEE